METRKSSINFIGGQIHISNRIWSGATTASSPLAISILLEVLSAAVNSDQKAVVYMSDESSILYSVDGAFDLRRVISDVNNGRSAIGLEKVPT